LLQLEAARRLHGRFRRKPRVADRRAQRADVDLETGRMHKQRQRIFHHLLIRSFASLFTAGDARSGARFLRVRGEHLRCSLNTPGKHPRFKWPAGPSGDG